MKRKGYLDFFGKLAVIFIILASLTSMGQSNIKNPIYLNPDQPIEKRVKDLLTRMTLEEKIGQMCQFSVFTEKYGKLVKGGKVGSFLNVLGAENTNKIQRIALEQSRLKIPLIFGFDVIHGYRTIFPIPLAEAATWNPQLVEKAASISALEATSAGIDWTFAPMVDIARDPRWGRIAEGFGEDPYLASVFSAAKVRGFQGKELSNPFTLVACLKHFVAYGAAEGGRDYNTSEVSERTLRNVYLPPFKAGVEAGAGTLMSAFNEISGIPASGNRHTLTEILRDEWKFDGFVVSDWGSIAELIPHGFAEDSAHAAKEAVIAGVDMDMEGRIYISNLLQLVKDGKIPEEVIDKAVSRILRIKFRAGLFEHPYTKIDQSKSIMLCKEHLQTAREEVRESLVLLKNEGNLLPLRKDIKSLAVIGPLADNQADLLGTWAGRGVAEDVVPIIKGIRNKVSGATKVYYAKGCNIDDTSTNGFDEALNIARKAAMVLLVVGESADMSGEAHSRAFLDLPGVQKDLIQAIYTTGTPTIVLILTGRPLSISWVKKNIKAILLCWHPGVQGGNGIADVLFGDYNPSGRLPVSFPRTIGQIPIYYNHKNTGRPPKENIRWTSKYIDIPWTPLFPFGYGESYTSFEYSNLQIKPKETGSNKEIRVSVDVKNTGDRRGEEVVQLYIHDLFGSVTRPVKELKGFKKISLKPGEKKTVNFIITPEKLAFYDRNMNFVVEPGTFDVMVGKSSENIQLTGSFEIIGDQ